MLRIKEVEHKIHENKSVLRGLGLSMKYYIKGRLREKCCGNHPSTLSGIHRNLFTQEIKREDGYYCLEHCGSLKEFRSGSHIVCEGDCNVEGFGSSDSCNVLDIVNE